MQIAARREVPGLATLYLGQFNDDAQRLAEFVDTREPGVEKSLKWVLMVSTQLGCPIGCRMCDAGVLGFHGNLTADEMLEQIRYVFSQNPTLDPSTHPKLKIHFARLGEPSLNPEVLNAFELLAKEFPYPGIMPSFSTVAPKTPEVLAFLEDMVLVKERFFNNGRFQFQFSLHSTDEAMRRRIVPVEAWSLGEIARYGRRFVLQGDRKITLNFALAQGEALDSELLRRTFDHSKFLIKITPVNPTASADASKSTFLWDQVPEIVQPDVLRLQAHGFEVIVSPSSTEEISGETSCGQLWSKTLKERALSALRTMAYSGHGTVGEE